ncbi:hypothetical protein FH972_003144 [Carpinus fangiana]|uniref:Transcription factor CBF/NF-Y/archaeal histone domain-containing protein n=1 Tax=Carpinus fangiana TaxID=176857 RepID=A0A5N6QHI7_9ROSI|nr:hypothetical protein FH972_003144 [Carpinus fangiana]
MADSDNESDGGRTGNLSANEMSPREQDRFLPIANVSRIMKKARPTNTKISKDAKETVAGVRVGVHQLRHRRGFRQVPAGEAQGRCWVC